MKKNNADRTMLEFGDKVFNPNADKVHMVHQGKSIWTSLLGGVNDKPKNPMVKSVRKPVSSKSDTFRFIQLY